MIIDKYIKFIIKERIKNEPYINVRMSCLRAIYANGLCMVSCGKSDRIFQRIGKLINSSEFSARKNPQQLIIHVVVLSLFFRF